MHRFGPPNEDAFSGHPLANRGLRSSGAFRVDNSSLVRQLERMNSVHNRHDPKRFQILKHYIFTFHYSTFECVAESFDSRIEHVGLDEEHARTLKLLKGRAAHTRPWLRTI
jgi:hypothetical protein